MEKVVVLGGGGFIGSHLVKYLKKIGYYVRAVDIKKPEFSESIADEFLLLDLTDKENCMRAVSGMTEVYNLAAKMGGMGFISTEHVASLYDSNLINTYSIEAAYREGVDKYFFSSSACVYPIHKQNTLKANVLEEKDVYPAQPNEAYGWEKLLHEIRCQAYLDIGLQIRVARFENTYGQEGIFDGGKEKAPAALSRKIALAKDGDEIEVWGDGKQTRSFMYVDDCVDGIYRLTQSDYTKPLNLGSDVVVSINNLAELLIKISGKELTIKHIDGPQGVRSRYIDHSKAEEVLNWSTKTTLKEGLTKTYKWIEKEVSCVR